MIIGIFDIALQLQLPEFVFIIIVALIIGFAAGFVWLNCKGGEEALKIQIKNVREEAERWRLTYYDLNESKEKAVKSFEEKIRQWEEKEEQQAIEIEELTLLNQQLMLKQKNAAAQQSNHTGELEAIKTLMAQNESELQQSKAENIVLKNELSAATEKIASLPDHDILKALQTQLYEADIKMNAIDIKTKKIEQHYTAGAETPIIIPETPIMENVSSWGMQKLRQELKRLTQQNIQLESKLNLLSRLEENYNEQEKK